MLVRQKHEPKGEKILRNYPLGMAIKTIGLEADCLG